MNHGFIFMTQKTKGNPWNIIIQVLQVWRNSKLFHQQKNSCSPSFGMQGACFTWNFWLKDQHWIPTAIVQPYNHSSNASTESGRKEIRFFSITTTQGSTLQYTNWGRHDKPEIHSGSTPSLQPRFGTVRLLVVPKIEGDVKRSTFFIGCQSWGSCAQMDQQPTRNFLHGRNEQMDRTIEKMCSKWSLCWKISVQCVREITFFHSDITVIIIHCQKLILYNWRPFLSITPRIYMHTLMMFVINDLENFWTNSSVYGINKRNKTHLNRPVTNLSCFQKGVSYSSIKIFKSTY